MSRRSTELFEFANGQLVGGLRESIDRFLETLIGVQIPGVVNVGEADDFESWLNHFPDSGQREYAMRVQFNSFAAERVTDDSEKGR